MIIDLLLKLLACHFSEVHALDLRNYEAQTGQPFRYGDYLAENNITKTALMVIGDCLGSDYELSRLYAPDFSTEFRKASK